MHALCCGQCLERLQWLDAWLVTCLKVGASNSGSQDSTSQPRLRTSSRILERTLKWALSSYVEDPRIPIQGRPSVVLKPRATTGFQTANKPLDDRRSYTFFSEKLHTQSPIISFLGSRIVSTWPTAAIWSFYINKYMCIYITAVINHIMVLIEHNLLR